MKINKNLLAMVAAVGAVLNLTASESALSSLLVDTNSVSSLSAADASEGKCSDFVFFTEDDRELGPIEGRLEIGFRAAAAKIKTKSKWNAERGEGFLGTMAYFDETESQYFSNLIISYKLAKWFAVSATYDEIAVVGRTETEDKHEDGEWYDKGPSLTAVFTSPYKLFDVVVPYAEVGLHFSDAGFDAYPWWGNGYGSPKDYEDLGRPSEARKYRVIDAESDGTSMVWGIGAKIYLTDNLLLDIAYRQINCEQTAHYYINTVSGVRVLDKDGYVIPFDYSQLCVGLRWAF